MSLNEITAEILGVTVNELVALVQTAEERGNCTCPTCLIGEGDLLCVACHYRYANCGEMCTKCYSYEEYCQEEDRFIDMINALGKSFGVSDAYSKFEAEREFEEESSRDEWNEQFEYQAFGVDQFIDSRGRVHVM